MSEPDPDIEAVVADVRRTVDERRRAGDLPAELDEQLESVFGTMRRDAARRSFEPLDNAIERQREASHFSRDRIPNDSQMPGGTTVHKATSALVRRQIDGLLAQLQEFADTVVATTELMGSMLGDPPYHHHDDLQADLDMVSDRVVDLERARVVVDALAQQVAVLEAVGRRERSGERAVDSAHLVDRLRTERHRDAAPQAESRRRILELVAGLDPVVVLWSARGDLLAELESRGVTAWGVEPDEQLAKESRSRGLEVRSGEGDRLLAEMAADTLGAVVVSVAHQSDPVVLAELVAAAHRAVRPGGVLLIETVNLGSLYVHTHDLWRDPENGHLVDAGYLEALCAEAGFGAISVEHVAPVPEGEALEPLPGDDEVVVALNRNIAKLNNVLFGPQGSLVVARV